MVPSGPLLNEGAFELAYVRKRSVALRGFGGLETPLEASRKRF